MLIFYRIFTHILYFLLIPAVPVICLFSRKRRANIRQRLGFKTGIKKKADPGHSRSGTDQIQRIWVHALSVGETISARPLISRLNGRFPESEIILTTSTKTGFDIAQKLFGRDKKRDHSETVRQIGYFPFDLVSSIRKICEKIEPDLIIIVETDLWPNFLSEMSRKAIPVVLVNARLSERSLKGYLRVKPFFLQVFSFLSQIIVQSRIDQQRFLRLGISKDKISVCGNIKFDQAYSKIDSFRIEALKNRLNIRPPCQVLLAGSIHPGEDTILLNAYQKMDRDKILMIIAPRDPEYCRSIQNSSGARHLNAVLMSEINESNELPGVVLVDQMGVLAELYAICDIAFIGGSMVKQGGHNPLEPAACSKPVLFGSDMSDFLMISDLLIDNGGAVRIENTEQLTETVLTVLNDRQLGEEMGRKNFEVFSKHSGAAGRIVDRIEELGLTGR